jgi:hypothetical protein
MLTPFGELPDRFVGEMSTAEMHDYLHRPVSRRSLLSGLGAAAVSPVVARKPRPTRHPATKPPGVSGRILTFGTDPRTEMTLGFSVDESFHQAIVHATAPGDSITATAHVTTVHGSPMRYCRAQVAGLRPDTAYDYKILIDGHNRATGRWTTGPSFSRHFRFTAFGDQATEAASVRLVSRVAAERPDFHISAGDLCYAVRGQTAEDHRKEIFDPRYWDKWLAQNARVAARVPWMCAAGNHEIEPGFGIHGYAGFLARVPLPGNGPMTSPATYSFRYGNVGFVALDSNDVSNEIPLNRGFTHGAQTPWLASTLSQLRSSPDIDFIVIVLHHSAYSSSDSHGSEGGIRSNWVPLFDQYDVDLVISGHNHCYERTLPLRRGQITGDDRRLADSSKGTTYITAGGGGAVAATGFIPNGMTRVSTADGTVTEKAPWTLPNRTDRHVVLVVDSYPAANGTAPQLMLKAVDSQSVVVDRATLQRASKSAAHDDNTTVEWIAGGAGALAVTGLVGGAAAYGIRARRNR